MERSAPQQRSMLVTAPPPRRSWLRDHPFVLVLVEVALLATVLGVLARMLVWILAGGAVLLVVVLLVAPLVGGRSLWDRMRMRMRYRSREVHQPDRGLPREIVPLAEWVPGLELSHTSGSREDETGVVSDGDAWAAALALESDEDLLADSGAELDLDSLVSLTTSDDIVFDGIQVVTYTVPAPTSLLLGPDSTAARAYAETTDDLPPALRRTWVCVRIDPTRCLAAVERRGTGVEGIHNALRFGLHRIQSLLKRQGVETRPLTSTELVEVLSLTCGADPDPGPEPRTAERWESWRCDHLVHASQVVRRWGSNPSVAYQGLLDAVARTSVLFAVTSFTISPDRSTSGGVRLVTADEDSAQAARGELAAALGRTLTLAEAGGVQVPTMLATVPLGRGVQLR